MKSRYPCEIKPDLLYKILIFFIVNIFKTSLKVSFLTWNIFSFPQVRVVQGKEPPCFLNLFEGSMAVHIGKREDASTNTAGPWRMYCLRGDTDGEVIIYDLRNTNL